MPAQLRSIAVVFMLGCSGRTASLESSVGGDEVAQTSGASESDTQTSGASDSTDSTESEGPLFIPIPDQPNSNDCYPPFGELCPEGEKCSPIIGECCGLFECVPVLGEGQHGDPCVIDEESNVDDCGPTSYCLGGVCREFCDGDANCPDDDHCLIYGSGRVWVCIDQCDPLVQDCPEGQGCEWGNEFWGFQCLESVGAPGLGEPCSEDTWNGCAPGLQCVWQSFPGGCGSDLCCTTLCDTSLGEAACSAGPMGSICTDLELWLAPGLGVCTAP